MIVTREDIVGLKRGRQNPIVVGVLPDKVWRALALPLGNVQLSLQTLKHIEESHPDLSEFDLLHIPIAIARGEILRETKKPDTIIAYYVESEKSRVYVAVMRVSRDNCECWLKSFYRNKRNEYGRWLKKAKVIYRAG